MTPLKWYEQISLQFMVMPFRWRLQIAHEPMWGSAHLWVGPFCLSVGWPTQLSAQQS